MASEAPCIVVRGLDKEAIAGMRAALALPRLAKAQELAVVPDILDLIPNSSTATLTVVANRGSHQGGVRQ